MSLYGKLQELAGTRYTESNYARDVIDSDMLRLARENDVALPSVMDTVRDKYHGAQVLNAIPGIHAGVVYMDLASLYPNLMRALNASPETLVGMEDDLLRSVYSESDCVHGWVDPRPVKRVGPSETYSDFTDGTYKIVYDPNANTIKWRDTWESIQESLVKCYYLDPDQFDGPFGEGILPSRADDYITWNKQYEGTLYKATKQQRNCFSADTEVVTPDGVVNIRDLSVGDSVYSIDPETESVEEKPVTETFAYPEYDGEMVSIEGDQVNFEVTPNHRMLITESTAGDTGFVEAGDLDAFEYRMPSDWNTPGGEHRDTVSLAEWYDPSEYEVFVENDVHGRTFAAEIDGEVTRTGRGGHREPYVSGYRLDGETYVENKETVHDLASDVRIHLDENEKWLPMEYDAWNFIELIGWYVTEGSTDVTEPKEYDNASRGRTVRTNIAQKTDKHRASIRSLFERMGLHATESDNGFAVSGDVLATALVRLCGDGSAGKRLPDFVYQCSNGQREMLYHRLLDGDGNERRNRYTTESTELRDDVLKLLVHTGRNPSYTFDNGVWRIRVANSENTIRPTRNVSSTEADDGVYCVEVADNHTLLAGRDGKFQFVGNSLYGVSGDTNFRLFDWRVAESITIAGRIVIDESIDYASDALDADPVIGDSVPENEPIIIRRATGDVDVLPAQRVHSCVTSGEDVDVWSDEGWTKIKRSIEKPNRKQHYIARTKGGAVQVTEDHSLLTAEGNEVAPNDIEKGDQLCHNDLVETNTPESKECVWSEDGAWLLGLFVADGTAGHYEYEHRTDKFSWAITNESRERLLRAHRAMQSEWGFKTDVNDTRESSGCLKLQSTGQQYGGEQHGVRQDIVHEFVERCYIDGEKRVPPSILNGTVKERRAFLDGYLQGDGSVGAGKLSGFTEMTTKSGILATQLAMMIRWEGDKVTIGFDPSHGNRNYRIRRVSYHKGDPTEVKTIEQVDYDGEHVYDFETENHHFHAGVGSIIVHNTDGLGIATALDQQTAVRKAMEVADELDGVYDDVMPDHFGVDDHYMDIEVESYASTLFVPEDDAGGGIKKTYAKHETWNDDDFADADKIAITGFEAIRSDVADITVEAQTHVLETILENGRQSAREQLFPYIRDLKERFNNRDVPLAKIGKRSGMSKSCFEYGSPNRSAHPTYRGAKYAHKHIPDEDFTSGGKPFKFAIERVGCDEHPAVYDVETREDGTKVDYISVEDPSNLPDCATVDYDVQFEKTVAQPMQAIFRGMDWSWEDAVTTTKQATLA
jgi:DNA polymerase elongation subunit (family B)